MFFLALSLKRCSRPITLPSPNEDNEDGDSTEATETTLLNSREEEHQAGLTGGIGRVSKLLMCIFFFVYVGAEVAYGSFLPTFVVEATGASRPRAARLASVKKTIFHTF